MQTPGSLRGRELIDAPLHNKGTAFSDEERSRHGLWGLLPPHVESLDEQVTRAYEAYGKKPDDLERHNPNLVGGDMTCGSMQPMQNFSLRPFPGWSRYRTPIRRLYLCGAATWPGAGTGASPGRLLGKMLVARGH